MTRERRLGRGLEALLGRGAMPTEQPASGTPFNSTPTQGPFGPEESHAGQPGAPRDTRAAFLTGGATPHKAAPEPGPLRIEVSRIDSNPFQPRQDFGDTEVRSLAESLQKHGLLQPVVVRRVGARFQLIAGERRMRAAIQAGWTEVPVQVVEADDRQVAELAIVENLHRKDLNPLEKAASFQSYLEQYGCTQEELANRLELDRSTIANLIRLLELPAAVQEALREGHITQGHARAILPLGDEFEQVEFCQRIRREGLSVRQTESLVQETIQAADAGPLGLIDRDGKRSRPKRVPSQHVAALEQELRAALGSKVAITHNSRGRGKLVIYFRSHDEFERLREYLCGPGTQEVRDQAG